MRAHESVSENRKWQESKYEASYSITIAFTLEGFWNLPQSVLVWSSWFIQCEEIYFKSTLRYMNKKVETSLSITLTGTVELLPICNYNLFHSSQESLYKVRPWFWIVSWVVFGMGNSLWEDVQLKKEHHAEKCSGGLEKACVYTKYKEITNTSKEKLPILSFNTPLEPCM